MSLLVVSVGSFGELCFRRTLTARALLGLRQLAPADSSSASFDSVVIIPPIVMLEDGEGDGSQADMRERSVATRTHDAREYALPFEGDPGGQDTGGSGDAVPATAETAVFIVAIGPDESPAPPAMVSLDRPEELTTLLLEWVEPRMGVDPESGIVFVYDARTEEGRTYAQAARRCLVEVQEQLPEEANLPFFTECVVVPHDRAQRKDLDGDDYGGLAPLQGRRTFHFRASDWSSRSRRITDPMLADAFTVLALTLAGSGLRNHHRMQRFAQRQNAPIEFGLSAIWSSAASADGIGEGIASICRESLKQNEAIDSRYDAQTIVERSGLGLDNGPDVMRKLLAVPRTGVGAPDLTTEVAARALETNWDGIAQASWPDHALNLRRSALVEAEQTLMPRLDSNWMKWAAEVRGKLERSIDDMVEQVIPLPDVYFQIDRIDGRLDLMDMSGQVSGGSGRGFPGAVDALRRAIEEEPSRTPTYVRWALLAVPSAALVGLGLASASAALVPGLPVAASVVVALGAAAGLTGLGASYTLSAAQSRIVDARQRAISALGVDIKREIQLAAVERVKKTIAELRALLSGPIQGRLRQFIEYHSEIAESLSGQENPGYGLSSFPSVESLLRCPQDQRIHLPEKLAAEFVAVGARGPWRGLDRISLDVRLASFVARWMLGGGETPSVESRLEALLAGRDRTETEGTLSASLRGADDVLMAEPEPEQAGDPVQRIFISSTPTSPHWDSLPEHDVLPWSRELPLSVLLTVNLPH